MKDNFSHQSEAYKAFRPVYPAAVFDYIIKNVLARKLAWDVGTGNGQTAEVLASYFAAQKK